MIVAETLTGLLTDRAHVEFEVIMEIATGAVAYPIGRFIARRAHRRFDAQHGLGHAAETTQAPATISHVRVLP